MISHSTFNKLSCTAEFTWIRSNSADLLFAFWDCLVWKGKIWKATSNYLQLILPILLCRVSLVKKRTYITFWQSSVNIPKGFVTLRNLGGHDKWHLKLLAFITLLIITSIFRNGGDFNGQDYMKGRDVHIESVAPN